MYPPRTITICAPYLSFGRSAPCLLSAALFSLSTLIVCAGDDAAAPAGKASLEPVAAATYNPLSFADGKVIFDVQERIRWENRSNNFDFNSDRRALTDGNWFEQRFRFGVALKPVSWLEIYAQGQDSREFNALRGNYPGVNAAEGDDAFDLRQGYVEIADYEKCSWGLKVGRQILSYGDERLVGSFDWNNFGRTFDAAKLTYKGPGFSVEAFTSTPAVIARSRYNESDLFNGDETHRGLVFSGIYLTIDPLPFGTWDFYSFLLDQPRGNTATVQGLLNAAPATGSLQAHSDFVTLGTRIKGDPKKLNGWEYSGEFAFQKGDVHGLNLTAFAATAGAGYNFAVPWHARFYVEYNYATGDHNPADGKVQTFQNLFPTNHPFYGIMDEFSWQNLHNALVSLRVSPLPSVTARVDYNAFWLADTNDLWYRSNGLTAIRPLTPAARDASNYAGSELDLIVTWNAAKYLQFQGGFSHFFAGNYLEDTGPHSDANFGYLQATLNF